jgi:hypothetical protein
MDLTDYNARWNYARKVERNGPIKPTIDHLTLLARSCWDWNGDEFGSPSMDPKRPFGNSDVEDDMAELLPHLSASERLKLYCELPAVLAYITNDDRMVQAIAVEAQR